MRRISGRSLPAILSYSAGLSLSSIAVPSAMAGVMAGAQFTGMNLKRRSIFAWMNRGEGFCILSGTISRLMTKG